MIEIAQKKEDAQEMNRQMVKDEVKEVKDQRRWRPQQTHKKSVPQEKYEGGSSSRKNDGEGRGFQRCSKVDPTRDGTRGKTCTKCGFERHQNSFECPAVGKTCHNCKGLGHYSKVCYRKLVQHISDERNTQTGESNTNNETDTDSE